MKIKTEILACAGLALAGCGTTNMGVVAVTGTTIGLEIGQAPANTAPALKFGYNRAEVAVVSEAQLMDGPDTADVANVIMELRYASGSANQPSVYQRLAVGKTAVSRPGAQLMFMKGSDGTLDEDTAKAVDEFIKSTSGDD